MVHSRRLGDETLTFGVSGMLWKDAFVMFDRETHSLWSHVTGECLEGEHAGVALSTLPSMLMPFAEWAAKYPQSRVLARPAGAPAMSRYARYAASERQGIFGTRARRRELEPKAVVQGVAQGDAAMAVSHEALRQKGKVTFRLGKADLAARWEDGAARVYRKGKGGTLTEVPSTSAYWFAWLNFYPATEVLR